MSPKKMIGLSFAAAAAKLCEAFRQAEKLRKRFSLPELLRLSKKYYFFEKRFAA